MLPVVSLVVLVWFGALVLRATVCSAAEGMR
jgi:hypothetical protein